MWTLVRCILYVFASSQFDLLSVLAAADEPLNEVKSEVVFKPEECSQKSKKGDLINAHYDGYLLDGSQFYCSVCASSSNGMSCKHVQRWKGPVPPNATVVFEVEVLSVSRGPRSMEAFTQIDLDKDKTLTKAEVKEYLKLEYEKGGKPRDEPFYEKIIADIFRKSDRDRDGLISSKEYNIYEHDEL